MNYLLKISKRCTAEI